MSFLNKVFLRTFLYLLLNLNQAHGVALTNATFKKLHDHLESGNTEQALFLLRNRTREMVGVDKELAHYAQGVLGVLNGQPKEALKEFKKLKNLPELKVYVSFYKAQAQYDLKRYRVSEALLRLLKKERNLNPDLRTQVNFLNAKVQRKRKRWTESKRLLTSMARSYSSKNLKPKVLTELLSHKFYTKNRYQRCRWALDLYTDYPNYGESSKWHLDQEQLIFKGRNLRCSIKLSHKRSRLIRMYRMGKVERAQKEVEDFKNAYLRMQLQTTYLYLSGQVTEAIALSKKLNARDKYSQLRLAKYLFYSGEFEEVEKIYLKLLRKHKRTSSFKAKVMYKLAELYLNIGNYERAEKTYKTILNFKRFKSYQKRAEYFYALVLFLREKHEESFLAFQNLVEQAKKHPKRKRYYTKDQAYYWMARSLEMSGQIDKAARVYKVLSKDVFSNYYGIVSAIRLESFAKKNNVLLSFEDFIELPWKESQPGLSAKKESFLNGLKLSSRMPSSLWKGTSEKGVEEIDLSSPFVDEEVLDFTPEKLDNSLALHLERFKSLSRIGFKKEASWELRRSVELSKGLKKKSKLINYFLNLQNFNAISIESSKFLFLSKVLSNEQSNRLWFKAYPRAFESKVLDFAEKAKVSSNLVWSIMRAESFFNTRAESSVGAKGLLQLMPHTAHKLNLLLGEEAEKKVFVREDLFDPERNIKLGASYLGRLSKIFNGKTPYIAAAYNAGPHRMQFWSKMYKNPPLDELIERLPFKETRSYIKKVTHNMFIYSALYEEKDGEGIDLSYLTQPSEYLFKGSLPVSETWEPL